MAPTPAHPGYRADIDGLRAVAVLLVVVFHAAPAAIPGGFIGVDVFFVISGFLISTILLSGRDGGGIGYREFYARRIRRIFPALCLVLTAALALGSVLLLADEFDLLGKHVLAGAGFFSNIILWREVGYFDRAAEAKPLLHLWSLGIEEQFYLLWPLLLGIAARARLPSAWPILLVAVGSAIWCLWAGVSDPAAAFYSPLARFWELALGGMLACMSGSHPRFPESLRISRSLVGGLGLSLVLGAAFLFDRSSPFPGWRALLPVCGSLMILAAGAHAWPNQKILACRALVWVGLISYPLYLWHWPLLAFARILDTRGRGGAVTVALVALAFLLAWGTYRWVERPIRSGVPRGRATATLVIILLLIGAGGQAVHRLHGLPGREVVALNPTLAPSTEQPISALVAPGCGARAAQGDAFANCVSERRGVPGVALVGDSKAAALFPGLVRSSAERGRWLFIGGNGPSGPVVPVLSDAPVYREFQALARLAAETVTADASVDRVVLTAAARNLFQLTSNSSLEELAASPLGPSALEGLDRFATALVRAGKQVVLTVDNPALPDPAQCVPRRTGLAWFNRLLGLGQAPVCMIAYHEYLRQSENYRQVLTAVAARHPGAVSVFDATDLLCDAGTDSCPTVLRGQRLYSYSDHISDAVASAMGRRLNAYLAALPRN